MKGITTMKKLSVFRHISRNSPAHIRIYLPATDAVDTVREESRRIVTKMF